jgi:hypothetical protein
VAIDNLDDPTPIIHAQLRQLHLSNTAKVYDESAFNPRPYNLQHSTCMYNTT